MTRYENTKIGTAMGNPASSTRTMKLAIQANTAKVRRRAPVGSAGAGGSRSSITIWAIARTRSGIPIVSGNSAALGGHRSAAYTA